MEIFANILVLVIYLTIGFLCAVELMKGFIGGLKNRPFRVTVRLVVMLLWPLCAAVGVLLLIMGALGSMIEDLVK